MMIVPIMIMVGVQYDEAVEDHIKHKPECRHGRHNRCFESWTAQLDCFGEKIKECDTDDRSRAEAEYKMQFIFEPQCKESSKERCCQCRQADEYDHDVISNV